ncbi:hypothetical protein JW930_04615 [Candidatus Woesearchaeota archaeon]|nr:hypothetical protein [Candidatus Woesearchaeota archaeon]
MEKEAPDEMEMAAKENEEGKAQKSTAEIILSNFSIKYLNPKQLKNLIC